MCVCVCVCVCVELFSSCLTLFHDYFCVIIYFRIMTSLWQLLNRSGGSWSTADGGMDCVLEAV